MQRFKGTEPEEELSEQVKAVKIEEKPKEVKAEVVDEVPAWDGVADCLLCVASSNQCLCDAHSQGPPKYTKAILKKGDRTNFPKKGDTVSCWYTGSLEDGTVFDSNVVTCNLLSSSIFLR